MTLDELKTTLAGNSSISGFLSSDEIGKCCTRASQETGWLFPVSGDFQEFWIENRAERHCFFQLWTQSARKFKVEQLNLNQRFAHYGEVIKKMDRDFEAIKAERYEMFDTSTSEDKVNMFGTVAPAGYVYDITGKDITGLVE